MALPRFFLDLPDDFDGPEAVLPPKTAHHAGRTLRLAAGEPVEVFNGRGGLWRGTIRFEADRAFVALGGKAPSTTESPLAVTLVQSFVSPEKTDWIVEKAVELGVARVILTPAERSMTKLAGDRLEKRLQKLAETAKAACEQCGRNLIPEIKAAPNLKAALEAADTDVRLMLAPGAQQPAALLKDARSVAFAVGPEGGFSERELALGDELGWSRALLGPRVLRTETAGLAAAVWAQTIAGDFPGI